jgi:hypothetical protein
MKKAICFLSLLAILIIASCSEDSNLLDSPENNPKSVTDCSLTTTGSTLVTICIDGANTALPNETFTVASKFNAPDSDVVWTVESGDIEIMKIENSSIGDFTKSVATVKFKSTFTGTGKVRSSFTSPSQSGAISLPIELEAQN